MMRWMTLKIVTYVVSWHSKREINEIAENIYTW